MFELCSCMNRTVFWKCWNDEEEDVDAEEDGIAITGVLEVLLVGLVLGLRPRTISSRPMILLSLTSWYCERKSLYNFAQKLLLLLLLLLLLAFPLPIAILASFAQPSKSVSEYWNRNDDDDDELICCLLLDGPLLAVVETASATITVAASLVLWRMLLSMTATTITIVRTADIDHQLSWTSANFILAWR